MSRRSVPHIEPADLRDVATEERVDRIWARLEQDLVTARAEPPRRASRAVVWAVAATFAAFGGGLVAGRMVWSPPARELSAAVATHERAGTDVFAAGSQERTYALPGGGSITLAPGSMIEMERAGSGAMRLRLLTGEASFDASQGALAIVSGEATVATAPGSRVRVQKRDDNLDVRVASGTAEVSSPAGTRALRMGEQMDGVPTRTTTTAVTPPVVRVSPQPTLHVARDDGPQVAVVQVAAAPSWRDHYQAGRFDEALELLKQEPGGLADAVRNAKSANELMAIAEIARIKGGDAQASLRAYHRVADELGASANGPIAARALAKHYESAGQADLAAKYLDQAAKGVLGEDVICDRMRSEERAGNKGEAAARASEYLSSYPNGRCKNDANRILAGDEPGEGSEPSDPYDAPAGSASAVPSASGAPSTASAAPSGGAPAPSAGGKPPSDP
ncbi:MAG: FecR domain-containing protein [Polyangiaceae bacterium]